MRRAGLLASRDDSAIANRRVLFFRFDARIVDALHAIRALFHDAAAAHGYFRIAQQLELRRFPILEAQEIESAHFVRAIVRTIPRPDAPVIGHIVQPFGAVRRGAHGADLLAGRVLALLARHRLEERFGIIQRGIVTRGIVGFRFGFVVAVDADPVHLPAARHLILPDHRNIVFRLARDDASVAAVAAIQVDGHGPLVAGVREFRFALVQGKLLRRQFGMFVSKIRILAIFLERSGGEDLAAFHVEVILRASERIIVAGFSDCGAWCGRGPKSVRNAYGVGVETFVRARVAGIFSAIAQRQNDNSFRLAWQDPGGCRDLAPG